MTVPFNIVKTNMVSPFAIECLLSELNRFWGVQAEGKDVQPSIASSLIEAAAFAEADIQKTTSSTFANGSAAVS